MQHFEQELTELKERLLTMASLAEASVNKAIQALQDRDDGLARRVRDEDTALDRLEVEIDEAAITLLAKAPLASDLRSITVAMKISHDLERVGDEVTKIAKRTLALNLEPPLKVALDIPGLARLGLDMLRGALDAFVNHDSAVARALIERDREVNDLNHRIHDQLVRSMILEPQNISRCLHLMVVAKSLERIADHAVNIAEEVVYLCEALDIRHAKHLATPAP
jgi:phosphate transport system protein